MPLPPRTASLSASDEVAWSDATLFDGFLLLGLVTPESGGTSWAELQLGGGFRSERLPLFQRIDVIDGKYDTSAKVLQNSSISPPNSKYAAWFYDNSTPPRKIAGPSTLFTVSTDTFSPPALTLTVPAAGSVPPTPDD